MFRRSKFAAALVHTAVFFAFVPPTAFAAEKIASDWVRPPVSAMLVQPTNPSKRITLAIILPLSNLADAQDFVAHVSKPGDTLYRKYLTPSQFAARFGVDAVHAAEVSAWARSRGLEVGELNTSGTIIPVSGTVSAFNSALNVRMNDYRLIDGAMVRAPDHSPAMPPEIRSLVSGIVGLSSVNDVRAFKAARQPKPDNIGGGGGGPLGGYTAAELRTAYLVSPQMPGARTETIGIFAQSGFYQSDVDAYRAENKISPVPVVARNLNGWDGRVTDLYTTLQTDTDIQTVIGMNPLLKQVVVYEDGNNTYDVALLLSLAAMAKENVADTIVISYGADELTIGKTQISAENQLFLQLAAQGQSVFAAAGNGGAYTGSEPFVLGGNGGSGDRNPGLNVLDPASQPLVTSVGGTTLFTDPSGNRVIEEVWHGNSNYATGGGVSRIWPRPAYQSASVFPNVIDNGGSAIYRNVPDVAASAGAVSVYSVVNGGWNIRVGTNVSAPIWAGIFSSVNASSKALGSGRIGFFNPALYARSPLAGVNDIRSGTNGNPPLNGGLQGYYAGLNYDNVSGWGSPDTYYFIYNFDFVPISLRTNPPPVVRDILTVATATTISISWKPSLGAKAYLILGNTFDYTPVNYVITKATTVTFSGLKPNTAYNFTVYATDVGGASLANFFAQTKTQ